LSVDDSIRPQTESNVSIRKKGKREKKENDLATIEESKSINARHSSGAMTLKEGSKPESQGLHHILKRVARQSNTNKAEYEQEHSVSSSLMTESRID
jgi:hypothetical protein